MQIETVVASFVVLMVLALVSQPLSRLVKLPYPSVLVIVGFVASEIAVVLGFDTGVRADNFQQLIFYVLLPVLVFESAYAINKQELKKNIFPILFLAVIGMLLTCGITAVILYYGIGHVSGFPWIAALLTGAILAATDPVSVVATLKEIHAPKRLSNILEGESLFNDATAIVVFGIFLSLAISLTSHVSFPGVVRQFFTVFLGGLCVGGFVGFLAVKVKRILKQNHLKSILTLVVAYGAFLLAEMVHVSGVMATLLAAIVMSSYGPQSDESESKALWDVVAGIANAIVFIAMGVVITIGMFEERWLAMSIAIISVLVARTLSTYVSFYLISKIQKSTLDLKSQSIMIWGGLRGAITLALALSLPTSLEYWWTIQSIAFGVVLFTLFVQAPTIKLLFKMLKI